MSILRVRHTADGRPVVYLSGYLSLTNWGLFEVRGGCYLAGVDSKNRWHVYDCGGCLQDPVIFPAALFTRLLEPYRICNCYVDAGCLVLTQSEPKPRAHERLLRRRNASDQEQTQEFHIGN